MYSTVAWAKSAADAKFSRIEITRNVSWAASVLSGKLNHLTFF